MGRWSTGIYQSFECQRIDLSYLLKEGLIQKGMERPFSLSWSRRGEPTGNISGISCWKEDEKYLRFYYTSTNKRTGEKRQMDFKVPLVSVPSNLGKGEILYMQCPGNGTRCKILYSAYGSYGFYSRRYFESKGSRIYYSSQALSKSDYLIDRRDHYRDETQKFRNRKKIHTGHLGSETKAYTKYKSDMNKLDYWQMRCDQRLIAFISKCGDPTFSF